ncbi:TIGR00725 family protein [bacterium]|nr:TIGR00725 family protein [bacterium]
MKFRLKPRIGIIGGSIADENIIKVAEKVGELVARSGGILVCGGLGGVMEAAARGAKRKGGFTIGILPSPNPNDGNFFIDLPIPSGMGEARNTIIVNTADAFIAIDGSYGTLSEIAFALNARKLVVGIDTWQVEGIVPISKPEEAVEYIFKHLK